MTMWNVFLNGTWVDGVWYDDNCDAEYVKNSLINHDGYESGIEVVKDA